MLFCLAVFILGPMLTPVLQFSSLPSWFLQDLSSVTSHDSFNVQSLSLTKLWDFFLHSSSVCLYLYHWIKEHLLFMLCEKSAFGCEKKTLRVSSCIITWDPHWAKSISSVTAPLSLSQGWESRPDPTTANPKRISPRTKQYKCKSAISSIIFLYKLVVISFVISGVMSCTYGSSLRRFHSSLPPYTKMLVVAFQKGLRCKESNGTGMLQKPSSLIH